MPETTEDQGAVLAFLSAPANHGGETPQRIDTHGAVLFLLAERVYKLKRAVRYPFLDYSTRGKRHAACTDEVALNRRTAPDLYLGVQCIMAGDEGLVWGGSDPSPDTVETVVVMRRFDSTLLDRSPTDQELTDLAEAVAAFHEGEPPVPDAKGASSMQSVQESNLTDLAAAEDLDRISVKDLSGSARAAFERAADMLDRRAASGAIRRCHGDLHLSNVCRWRGRPTPFDCIEFDPALATIDTLYDLAFLLMDLDARDRRDGASLVLNRYLEKRPGEIGALSLLPLFLSVRAQILTKVTIAAAGFEDRQTAAAHRREAARLLDHAISYLTPVKPVLVAVGGLSGSGKSTVARGIAPSIGPAPGAVVIRADAVRKRLFGAARDTDRLPPAAYTQTAHRDTYAEMERLCAMTLAAGHAAIADATFLHPESRTRIEAVAKACNTPFKGIWLEIDPTDAVARVETRQGDVSDADATVVGMQATQQTGAIDWTRVDATRPSHALAAAVSKTVNATAETEC